MTITSEAERLALAKAIAEFCREGAMKRWYEDCVECRGTGSVHSVEDESSPEYDSGKFKDCPTCGGTGKVRK